MQMGSWALLVLALSVAKALDTDMLVSELRRLGLSKVQLLDVIQHTPSTSEDLPPELNTPTVNEIERIERLFPEGVKDVTGSARCPIDGSVCYEVIIAPAGAHLDLKNTGLRRLKKALNPDYRSKAKRELKIFFRIPKQYPEKAVHLRITNSKGFLKKDVRRLESVLRNMAQRSGASLEKLCRRALRFVTDSDDPLRTQPISIWIIIAVGLTILFLYNYVKWRLDHVTTIYHR